MVRSSVHATVRMASNMFDDNEALVKLHSDEETQQTSELGHTLYETIDYFLENVRPKTIKQLGELKAAVEKSYDDSRKARIAGTTATVTGSTIAIIGFGLGFVTLGTSLGLTVIGAALAAAGGVTIGGAEIGYLAVYRKKLKEAEKACSDDNNEMQNIEIQHREFCDHLNSLVDKHPKFTKEAIFHLLRYTWESTEPTVKTFYTGYKLIDGAVDVGRNAVAVTSSFRSSVRVGVQTGARTVYVGLGTVGRVFSIGSVALDILFIPIDIAVLAKSAHDVHKYKKTKVSNSAAAKNIASILDQLEKNKGVLENIRDQLPGAKPKKVQDQLPRADESELLLKFQDQLLGDDESKPLLKFQDEDDESDDDTLI